ncbi:hypothetical protein A1O3_02716 [Capronia epimyces CBS 606.96]|uniref:Pectinesterase inhibitor domain-containing protein n=1 Tax=Capronia epimyces CBS 606.96 TaxID=1182542 RepID=W9Z571_9EURO|nr:uncharacterized protein A1O3_02716 [Capronia epimyces CBS 606.96]EXJ89649.1 hypothetical protein A1O3_02716 [Capronia epimyces CBS 606.96]
MAVADTSAFCLSLANAALFMNQITTGRQGATEYSDCAESARYYSECLDQVTRRLASSTECTSDGVITTVLGFLCHDSSVGAWKRWRLHVIGLERILRLRGDVSHLGLDVALFILWYVATLRSSYKEILIS